MAYFLVQNFGLGIDRRRPRAVGANGSVWEGVNVHLSRGGDIEKRKAFTPWRDLPAGTFGLSGASGSVFVFGSIADPGAPQDVTYQRLLHPAGESVAMTAFNDVTVFSGKPYVSASYADGRTYHFYDGTIVQAFVAGRARADMGTVAGLLAHLVTIVVDSRVTDAVASATTINITNVTLNQAFTVSVEAFDANSVAVAGFVAARTTAASPGVAEIWTITHSAPFSATNRYSIGIAIGAGLTTWYGARDNPVECGKILFTQNSKVYQCAGSVLSFSGVGAPTGWNSTENAGAGSINMGNHASGSAVLTGIENFQGSLAIFSGRAVQIWNTKEDSAQNAYLQTLRNTGTRAPGSVLSFGDVDTFYLDESGLRSIKARSGINSANVSDVGTAIDPYVRAITSQLSTAQIAAALAIIEPVDGRFLLFLDTRVLVFSYFPSAKTTAWTSYTLDFVASDVITIDAKLFVRAADRIYLYGGDAGSSYDSCPVTVELPFITGEKPGSFKCINGIDIIAEGVWEVTALADPRDETRIVNYGTLEDITIGDGAAAGSVTTPFIAPKLMNEAPGPASLSMVLVHYEAAEEIM